MFSVFGKRLACTDVTQGPDDVSAFPTNGNLNFDNTGSLLNGRSDAIIHPDISWPPKVSLSSIGLI